MKSLNVFHSKGQESEFDNFAKKIANIILPLAELNNFTANLTN